MAVSNSKLPVNVDFEPKTGKRSVTVLESKKRRTDSGHNTAQNTELDAGSDDDEYESMDQEFVNGPKNGIGAVSGSRTRLAL